MDALQNKAWAMEIYDNSRPKEPKKIGTITYPSKEAEKIKRKIDNGDTRYIYNLVCKT